MPPSRTATRFVFDRYELIPEENGVVFEYVIEYPDHPAERFRETLTLPWMTAARWKSAPKRLLDRVLQTLHIALGLNYWKMYCPSELILKTGPWSKSQMAFWETVYTKGLGEFYYKNQIDFRSLIHFSLESTGDVAAISVPLKKKNHCLVPIGGGKDSMCTAQLLKGAGFTFDAYTLGTSSIQERAIEALAIPWRKMERQLDPLMLMRSKSAEVYNGHVPITLVYTFTSLLTAVLGGYAWVVFSAEKSANIGNVEYLGMEINHQWSKSLEFEELMRAYVSTYITPSIQIFSLLRPLHEIEIMRRFVEYGKYFDIVSSCNRNFVIASIQPKAERGAYWCGSCPKCAFVFALFAAFLPKARVCELFGKNLFADEALLPLFQELLGLKGVKPFECVGLPEEVLVAFDGARAQGEWSEDIVMKWVIDQGLLEPSVIEGMKKELFAIGDLGTVPEVFKACFA